MRLLRIVIVAAFLAAIALLLAMPADAASRMRQRNGARLSPVLLSIPADVPGSTLTAARGPQPTVTRASSRTCMVGGTLQTLANDVPCVESNGLLVELQRTNIALNSAAVSLWGKGTVTITEDAYTANGLNLDRVTPTSANQPIFQDLTTTSSIGPFTASAWAAAPSGTANVFHSIACRPLGTSVATCSCRRSDGGACTPLTDAGYCGFNTTVGTTPVRLEATATCAVAVTAVRLYAAPGSWNMGSGIVNGAGVSVLYGMGQVEPAAAFASSYIPTAGTPVTRLAGSAQATGLPLTGDWYIKAQVTPQGTWGAGGALFGLGTDAAANSASLYQSGTGLCLSVRDGTGAEKKGCVSGIAAGVKTAMACNSSGTLSLYLDGAPQTLTLTGTGTGMWSSAPTTAYLGSTSAGNPLVGWIRSIQIGRGCRL